MEGITLLLQGEQLISRLLPDLRLPLGWPLGATKQVVGAASAFLFCEFASVSIPMSHSGYFWSAVQCEVMMNVE